MYQVRLFGCLLWLQKLTSSCFAGREDLLCNGPRVGDTWSALLCSRLLVQRERGRALMPHLLCAHDLTHAAAGGAPLPFTMQLPKGKCP